MPIPEERRKRGADLLKKYSGPSGGDKYVAASDAIADILLFAAEDEDDARKLLHSAEEDYRCTIEEEGFITEG